MQDVEYSLLPLGITDLLLTFCILKFISNSVLLNSEFILPEGLFE